MYAVTQDGNHYDQLPDLNDAIQFAEELLGAVGAGECTTFAVEDLEDRVLASVTNRRIVGRFTKQCWAGRKNDSAIFAGHEDFDATNAVLLMNHAELVELEDGSEASDSIGQDHVSWNGPCEVAITDSICAFFGVTDVEEISPENLAYARNRLKPEPPVNDTITLTMKVRLQIASGASMKDFVENLAYSVTSNTVGVIVRETELLGPA